MLGLPREDQSGSEVSFKGGVATTSIYSQESKYLDVWIEGQIENLLQQLGSQYLSNHSNITKEDPTSKEALASQEEDTRQWEYLKHLTISRDQTAASEFENSQLFILHNFPRSLEDPTTIQHRIIPTAGANKSHEHVTYTSKGTVVYTREKPSNQFSKIDHPPHLTWGKSLAMDTTEDIEGATTDQEPPTEASKIEATPRIQDIDQRIEELEKEISSLQGRLRDITPKQPVFQVFNCIGDERAVYLDTPSWNVMDNEGITLKGNQPISSLDAYLSRKGNVAFVVFRTFTISSMAKEIHIATRNGTTIPDPKVDWDRIRLYSQPMKDAAKAFFEGLLNHNINVEADLESLFPMWYHYRSTKIINDLPREQQSLVKLLTDWIDAEYESKYSHSDNLFKRGVVTRSTFPYLFRPGEVVVYKERSGGVSGCMVTSGPWILDDNDRVPQGGTDFTDDETWVVSTWSYMYDGKFWKDENILSVGFTAEEDNQEVEIKSLAVFPLRFATEDLKLRLQKRGKTFWSCRYRRLISYGAEKDESLVSHNFLYLST